MRLNHYTGIDYILSTEYLPEPVIMKAVNTAKNNNDFSILENGSSKWTMKAATNIVAAGKKLNILALNPIKIKIGAINSEKNARNNVGVSPIPIGSEKLKFPSKTLLSFPKPWPKIIEPQKTILNKSRAIEFIIY